MFNERWLFAYRNKYTTRATFTLLKCVPVASYINRVALHIYQPGFPRHRRFAVINYPRDAINFSERGDFIPLIPVQIHFFPHDAHGWQWRQIRLTASILITSPNKNNRANDARPSVSLPFYLHEPLANKFNAWCVNVTRKVTLKRPTRAIQAFETHFAPLASRVGETTKRPKQRDVLYEGHALVNISESPE